MKLYFDDTIYQVDNDKNSFHTFYSPKNHNAIQLDNDAAKIMDYVLSKQSGYDFDVILMSGLIEGFETEAIENLINELVASEIFFTDSFSCVSSDFKYTLRRIKEFNMKQAYIHLTMDCNLRCTYCYNRELLGTEKSLGLPQWLNLIDELKEKKVSRINLTGGEVLVYPYYKEIIDRIHENGIKVTLLTNGTLLDYLSQETASKINSTILSLDSLEINEYRVNSEKYDILGNLLEFKKKGHDISVRSVLTTENVAEVTRLRDFCKEHDIFHITTSFVPNSIDELYLVPRMERYVNEFYIDELLECSAANSIMAIYPNGDVYPCQCLMKPEFLLTNIQKEDWWSELKNSYITNYFSNTNIHNIKGCENCEVKYLCGGGCRAIAYNVYDNIHHKLDFFCDEFKDNQIKNLKNMAFD